MKYLDINSFLSINSILDNLDLGESLVNGRVEAYSCKTVGSDKKLYKELEYQISMSKSPKGPAMEVDLSVSPFGPLTEGASKKTFMYLIATLNSSYFDYDFSQATPEQFRKEPNRHMITNSINTTLQGVVQDYNSDLRDKLWSAIDMEIDLQKADIYSYVPDTNTGPFTEDGVIWSFNYFFYNRTLKRIVFFKCRALSKSALSASGALHVPRHRDVEEDISDEESTPAGWAQEGPELVLGEMEFDTTSILI
eukprot:Phypoly_transcript_15431.p1 GENE.Phypoly_transcript_15431~~Phypoly_transcript_15431.p1  ORF type:complete len:280 (+),score=35.35 Phypoly_transcript_15431:89-841(+)